MTLVSAIIINTKKGRMCFDLIIKDIIYKKCKINDIISGNPSLKESCSIPLRRNDFFIDIDKLNTNELVKKYAPKPSMIRMKIRSIKKKLKKIIKSNK